MERVLPAGLSDQQRRVLLDFFKGHVSAGQLTERLGIEPSPQIRDSQSERQPRLRQMRPVRRRVRAFLTVSWLRRRLAT
jgi:hypothetical protein